MMNSTIKEQFLKQKSFYITMFSIALPITLQNFIGTSLNLVDTVMVGKLGESAIASVNIANQVFFLLTLLLFGISSGSSIFTAQFWGKKDLTKIHQVLSLCLVLGTGASIIFTLAALFLPVQIMELFSKDPIVINLGVQYLRMIAVSYIFTAVSFAYSFVLRSTDAAAVPMLISSFALVINTLLNFVLIFGYWGAPALGVLGSALATVIARVVEMILLLYIVYLKKYSAAAPLKELFNFSKAFIKHFLNVTIPVILNEFAWALGITLYALAFAKMGTTVTATFSIFQSIERFSLVLFFGMGSACAVMLGNEIGAGNEKLALQYAKKYILIGPLLGIIVGFLIWGSSSILLQPFKVSKDVINQAQQMLLVLLFIMPFKVFNLFTIIGVLRSGGDTKYALVLDLGSVWIIGVPLAFLGVLVLRLPVYWIYALISIEEIVKSLFGVYRILSKKWLNNIVNHPSTT